MFPSISDTVRLTQNHFNAAQNWAMDSHINPFLLSSVASRQAADTVAASEIYGPYSYVPSYDFFYQSYSSVAEGTGYQIIIILLLVAYTALVLGCRREIGVAMRRVWGKNGETGGRADNDMPGIGVQVLVIVCGSLMAGIASVRLCEFLGGPLPFLSSVQGWMAVLGAALLFPSIMLVQKLMLNAAGALTFSRETVRIINIRRFYFFLSITVTGTPVLLMGALYDGWWLQVAALIFAAVTVMQAVLYVFKGFFLFVEQKVSILLWILYLCTVETMPLCIVVIGLMRSWPV